MIAFLAQFTRTQWSMPVIPYLSAFAMMVIQGQMEDYVKVCDSKTKGPICLVQYLSDPFDTLNNLSCVSELDL